MAYRLNPFTGNFENVIASSSFSPDGDLQAGVPISTRVSYFETKAVKYYSGIALGPILFTPPLVGQPIPIGMGLTFLYNKVVDLPTPKVPVSVVAGQSIPVGMGLTVTYANKVN